MMKKILSLLLCFAFFVPELALAIGETLPQGKEAYALKRNYVKNPEAKLNTRNVTGTNVTVSRNTSAPTLGETSEFSFTIDSATDVVEWATESLPERLKNADRCLVELNFKADANAHDKQLQIYRDSEVFASVFLQQGVANEPSSASIPFNCGDLTQATTVRLVGTTSNATAFKAIVKLTELEAILPATITIGSQAVGKFTIAGAAGCRPTRNSSSSFGDLSADSDCPTPVATGGLSSDGTKTIKFKIDNATVGDTYTFLLSAGFYSEDNERVCSWRLTDGTNHTYLGTVYGSGQTMTPSLGGTMKFETGGEKSISLQTTTTNGTGNCSVDAGANSAITVDVSKTPGESKLAGAIITDEPWYYISSKNPTRVTGSAPDADGEYRSYLRNGNANTYTETNGSPTDAPSVANGFRIYNGNAYSSGDSNNNPTRYELFIGKNASYQVEWYASSAKTGFVDITPVWGSNAAVGYYQNYDPSTGILTITPNYFSSGTTTHNSGMANATTVVDDVYFDVKVFSNPLAAGMKTATDVVRVQGPNGLGGSSSGDTKIANFLTVLEKKGDAITYTPRTSTEGDKFTANKDGFYCVTYNDNFSAISNIGLTLNSANTSTNISALSGAEVLTMGTQSGTDHSANIAWCGPLKRGDIVRAHTIGGTRGSGSGPYMGFTIAKVPSPFEIAGGAGSSGGGTPFMAKITNGGSCSVASQSSPTGGNWVSSISHQTGGCALTITGFTNKPFCQVAPTGGRRICTVQDTSNTSQGYQCLSDGGSDVDVDVNFSCWSMD